MLHLGACEVTTSLPSALAFWRDFGRRFMTALCATPELEDARDRVEVPPPTLADLERLARAAPPMEGGEYLTAGVLQSLWSDLLHAWRQQVQAWRGSVQELLTTKDPAWNVVGRVHLHLAENKRDSERPFAFLATYTTGLTAQGKPQHRPLGQAVRESSSARDKGRLLALLAPLQKAARLSGFIKELLDRGELFEPLAWTPREAYRFIQEIPAVEQSGVRVRLPDWWKARPPRPQVTVSVGGAAPSMLGLGAMLDFSVRLTLDGEELSERELRALRAAADGLVLLKGKWVEVDRGKLDQVLAHWEAVQRRAGTDGISFIEGMRLLAGAPVTEAMGEASEAVPAWTGVQAGPWLSEVLAGLRQPEALAAVEPGVELRATLRPYQRAGLRWLWLLCRLGLGACLADDMGLGKTLQVLALLLALKQRTGPAGPHLLVAPASLLANWRAEAERFTPSLRVLVAHPSAMPEAELANLDGGVLRRTDFVITSYGAVHRLAWLRAASWGLVILDEAQAIKNPGAKQTRAVKQLKSRGRIALTGTPIENRLGDLWSLFDFLNPGLLGSAEQFGRFIKRLGPGGYGPLRELVRPYILRRLKTDRNVISDLPEKTELRAYCSLSRAQAALYQQSVESLAREISEVDGMQRRGLVLAYLLRFKQICNHPSQWLGDGGYSPEDSGKYARLRELCEEIASRQEKVLVFTQFREMAAPLAGFLAGVFGRPGLVLHGQTAVKQRQELVRRFQEDEAVPFFVLSLKAGGTGLNLTAASHVIHFDRWWNPAVENQATDRAFRIGQKKSVLVHKFVCRGTVEERIDALLESKAGLSKELLEMGEELRLSELKDEELLRLVSLDLRQVQADG
ncbi:MAG TPA: DEAD/DEAH box helicase [Myxococcaceae bacterium]|nr:DEAD/DEAH box helicase [Myxococcaceae bacterium]